MPQLSEALSLLLQSAGSVSDEIANASPALVAEAQGALPALRQRVEQGGKDAVRKVLIQRFATYPQPKRTDEEWSYWWADYEDALSDQPAQAIEAGMREWVRTDQTGFMPRPGQLLTLVKAAAEPHWRALSRATRLAKTEPKEEPTPETLEDRQRMAAEVRQLFAIKPKDETQ